MFRRGDNNKKHVHECCPKHFQAKYYVTLWDPKLKQLESPWNLWSILLHKKLFRDKLTKNVFFSLIKTAECVVSLIKHLIVQRHLNQWFMFCSECTVDVTSSALFDTNLHVLRLIRSHIVLPWNPKILQSTFCTAGSHSQNETWRGYISVPFS